MTLGEMLHTQTLRDPGATVLVCEEEKHSYGELDTRYPEPTGSRGAVALWLFSPGSGLSRFCSAAAVGLVVRHLQL